MIQQQLRAQAGVTLVELMISLTLGVLLLWGITSIMVSGHLSYSEAQRFTALQGDLSYINDSILVDSRGATAVVTANNSTQLTLTT
ncbi:MAG: PilW family protein, partial [Rheinheimera sp.]